MIGQQASAGAEEKIEGKSHDDSQTKKEENAE